VRPEGEGGHGDEGGHEEGLPEEALGPFAASRLPYCSLTIVLTLAVTPSAISTTTM